MRQFDRQFFKDLWHIVKPYWFSEEKFQARGLLFIVIALNLAMVYLNVLFNAWYKEFYNALQQLNSGAFWKAIFKFCILAFFYIVSAVYALYLNQMLQIKWRRWLTDHYLEKWMKNKTYYHMQVFSDGTDNPDQRISDDLNMFVTQTLTLSIGLLSSVVTLGSFIGILWTISGPLVFSLFGHHIVIPGYMVWAAILYAVVGTWLTAVIGKPLIKLNFDQQRFEADFRFNLVRIRENSESVAMYSGERKEHKHLMRNFMNIFENYWKIMVREKLLTWFTSGYNQIAIIFPILVAAPRFFAKKIHLGGLMQIAQAFGQVQTSLSYIVDSYTTLANWHAVVDRLRTFEHNIKKIWVMQENNARIKGVVGERLIVRDLTITLPDGVTPLVEKLNFSMKYTDRMLIMGPSGIGKSTLVRAIAGLWPFGEGKVVIPPREKSLFLPQRPYLPLGTLKDVLIYPYGDPATRDEVLEELLLSVGLKRLIKHLHTPNMWAQVLSLGEQQLVAFVRIFLQRPEWIYMDEATSALDEEKEEELYTRLRMELPHTGVISVGHRSTLIPYHNMRLILLGSGRWRIDYSAGREERVVIRRSLKQA